MKKIIFLFSLMSMFIGGCILSQDKIQEYKVADNYYITFFYDNNSVIYRDSTDSKTLGSGLLIFEKIDSIGMSNEVIIGFKNTEYIFVNKKAHQTIGKCYGRESFSNMKHQLGIDSVILMSVNEYSN